MTRLWLTMIAELGRIDWNDIGEVERACRAALDDRAVKRGSRDGSGLTWTVPGVGHRSWVFPCCNSGHPSAVRRECMKTSV